MVLPSPCAHALASLAVVLALGCSDEEAREPLVVFAASSLTEAFGELERAYEAAHPAVDVQLTFAGSQVLRLQIEQGAPADVFASADPSHLEALRSAGAVQSPAPFAASGLALIVSADSPIERFEDLDRAERLVVGAPTVPVGRYTRELLERAEATHGAAFVQRIGANVVSEESNVRLVRTKVALGEADAAIVYRTEIGDLRSVPIPPELDVRATYAVAATSDAVPRRRARAFVAFVRSPAGQAILEAHGFRPETAR